MSRLAGEWSQRAGRAVGAAHSVERLLVQEPLDALKIWQITHHYRRNPAFLKSFSELGRSRFLLHYATQELRFSTSTQTLSVCESLSRAALPICDCMNVARTKALLWSGERDKAFHILEQKEKKDELWLDWCNLAIRMHAANGNFVLAERSLEDLRVKSLTTSLSFMPLIVTYAAEGREARARAYFEEMIRSVGDLSNTIYYDLISALCLTNAYEFIFEVCIKALTDGYSIPLRKLIPIVVECQMETKPDQAVKHALRNLIKHLGQRFKSMQNGKISQVERADLLLLLSKAGKTGLVYELSEFMHPSELSPQIWDQIVRGFIEQGMVREAESVLVQSLVGKSQNRPGKQRTALLPEGSYVYFLNHLVRKRRFKDFIQFAEFMDNHNIPPTIFVVNHILQGYIAMRQYDRVWRAYPTLIARREQQPNQNTWRHFWLAMFKDSHYNERSIVRPLVRSLFADMAAGSAFDVESRLAAYIFQSFLQYNDKAVFIVALDVLRSKFKLNVGPELLAVMIHWHVKSLEREGVRDAAERETMEFSQARNQSQSDHAADHLRLYVVNKLGKQDERAVVDARREMGLGLN